MGLNNLPKNMKETCSELILSRKAFKEIKCVSHCTFAVTEVKLTWGSRSSCSTLLCSTSHSLPRAALPTKNREKRHHWETESTGLGRCFTRWENTKVSITKLLPTTWVWGSPKRSAVREAYLWDIWDSSQVSDNVYEAPQKFGRAWYIQ